MCLVMQRVAGALAGVQAQIAKEAVVWKAGPLVMAPLVQSSLAASQVAAATTAPPLPSTQTFQWYCSTLRS